jgi:dipeptidyl aminopeptidase/acylaminoacyl peptidase
MRHRPLSWIVSVGLLAAPPLAAQAEAPSVDPKGRYAVYLADGDTDGDRELYRSELKSGQAHKLNGPLAPDGQVESYVLDFKGRNVVYYADEVADGGKVLYRSLLKSGQRLKLSNELVSDTINGGGFAIDPKSRYVVYRSDHTPGGVTEIFRSDLNTGEPLKLNGPMVEGGGVFVGPKLGPKGRYVVYRADQDTDGILELYRSDLKTGAQLKLNGPIVEGGNVAGFTIGPKGRYVVYRADQEVDQVVELYVANLKTGASKKLNPPLADGAIVFSDAIVDPRGRYAIYLIQETNPPTQELYRSDLVSGAMLKLSGDMVAGGSVFVTTPQVNAKGRYVTYVADQDTEGVEELYRSDLITGQNIKLSGPMVANGDVTVSAVFLDPKGRYAIYRADQLVDQVFELFRSDLKTGSVLKLSANSTFGGDVLVSGIKVGPKGRYAVYVADHNVNGVNELFASHLKTGAVKRLNEPLPPGGGTGFFHFLLDPKGRHAVYSMDQDTQGLFELYRSDLKKAQVVKLNAPLVAGGTISSVQLVVDPKGRYAVYPADQDTDEVRELYRSLLTNGSNRKLNDPLVKGGDVSLN